MRDRPVRAVARITEQGWVYVFDRETGEPLWPIEERPVPPSHVPGERASPTQPFPSRPPPFTRQGVTEDDLIDFTPELRRKAKEAVADLRLGPVFTPAEIAGHPALEGIELPRTGRPTRVGVLVTRTLLFAGEGVGGLPVLRAHDKATGEILAEIDLPAPQTGIPMTYLHAESDVSGRPQRARAGAGPRLRSVRAGRLRRLSEGRRTRASHDSRPARPVGRPHPPSRALDRQIQASSPASPSPPFPLFRARAPEGRTSLPSRNARRHLRFTSDRAFESPILKRRHEID